MSAPAGTARTGGVAGVAEGAGGTEDAGGAGGTGVVGGIGGGRVRDLWSCVHAEWTKLRSLPSTAWLALAVIAVTVALGATVAWSIDLDHCPAPVGCAEDPVRLALGGVQLGQVAVVVLAALAVTGEYGSGTIVPTLLAVPRRGRVLAAKATVVTATVLAAGALGVLGSLLAGRAILPGKGFTAANGFAPLSPADGPTLRAAAGTVLYLGLVALLAVGTGLVLRDTAGTITAVLALLYGFPLVTAFVSDPLWSARLHKIAPMTAGLAVQATRRLDQLPIQPWPGLGVLAVWTGATVLSGAVLFRVRDA